MTQTWTVTTDTFGGLAQMISGQRGTDELGGPLRIAQLSGQVAQLGVSNLVSFIAVLSVNLGLINLFPDPGAGWRPSAVLPGRGAAWAAVAPAGAGIQLPGGASRFWAACSSSRRGTI